MAKYPITYSSIYRILVNIMANVKKYIKSNNIINSIKV